MRQILERYSFHWGLIIYKHEISQPADCRRILVGRKLVYVRIVVTAIFGEEVGEARNSNPQGRCQGERRKEGRGGEKKNKPADIIVFLGYSVRWQTELLIGAAYGKQIDACQSTVSQYCLFRFRLHTTAGKNYSEFGL